MDRYLNPFVFLLIASATSHHPYLSGEALILLAQGTGQNSGIGVLDGCRS